MDWLAALTLISWMAMVAVMASNGGKASGAVALIPPVLSIALALLVLAA